jgi:hypothetical protein
MGLLSIAAGGLVALSFGDEDILRRVPLMLLIAVQGLGGLTALVAGVWGWRRGRGGVTLTVVTGALGFAGFALVVGFLVLMGLAVAC